MVRPLFARKKYVFNTSEFLFSCALDYFRNECVAYDDGWTTLYLGFNKKIYDSIEFYVHEFTETSIMGAMHKMTRKWHYAVRFKPFLGAHVAHLISFYGLPNGRTLFPDGNPQYRKLYKEQMRNKLRVKKIIEMGDLTGSF